ncbi:MAG TPA: hypothetical protein VLE99_04540 [Candidatus Saccharimonadales bacterium]|nr:hypothetical protein [Candidatus Saccharimonadales bacterium]
MAETRDDSANTRTSISLYEFYAIGIERLIEKAPWELERSVSAYHQSFLTEQRCLGLTILMLLGEEHVPNQLVQAMPGFEDQTRHSVNQAVFLRALKHYFQTKKLNAVRADMVLDRMQSYLNDSRAAHANEANPLEAMLQTMARRVPPRNDIEHEQYAARVEKIYAYIEGLVRGSLLKRYSITS